MSESQLRLARNEIYARHGRIFDSVDLRDYFESQSWYNGTIEPADFSESVLNEYEKANIKLIQSLEDSSETVSGTSGGTNSIITTVPSGQSYSCDLNGDGITETISVKNNNEKTEVQLLINGENCAEISWAWAGACYIVDVDSSDSTLQIGVQYDTEDDYTGTAFYSYDSGGVHLLDYIPGSFYGDGPYPNITCVGDGTIQSYKALSVFETWFTAASWMLKDGKLVELVPSVYEPLNLFNGRGIDLTVIRSIEVTKEEPYFGDLITLPAGTKVHMTGTDNYDWVSMTADGYDGTLYLQLYDGYQVFLAGTNDKVGVVEVFDNLSLFG